MKSAVTISLVPEARGGPFVFWDDLAASMQTAHELGFDAVELFLPSPDAVPVETLRNLLDEHQLHLAAVGTGAGWVKHKLHLCKPDADERRRAIEFIAGFVDVGAQFGAPAIIGSMQGRWDETVPRDVALDHLSSALNELGAHAGERGTILLLEPLNRYETNLINTVADGRKLIKQLSHKHVKLLVDLFHMNIEEADIAEAIRRGAKRIGHVHFVDSNRRAAGYGHLKYGPITHALMDIGYQGYLSAEAHPYPDSLSAAGQTIKRFRALARA
jgi:sugar phosphate isomerase/epimerase